MKRILVLVAMLALAIPASAQQYKWVDEKGRTQYGDTPPPGAKATRLRPPPPGSAPAPAAKGAPLTAAERDAAYRKRQLDAQKDKEKQDVAQQQADALKENCARTQEYLRALESGQRISRTDSKGERYYIDDAQRAAEIAQARQSVSQSCGK
jgi:hypothetical protein